LCPTILLGTRIAVSSHGFDFKNVIMEMAAMKFEYPFCVVMFYSLVTFSPPPPSYYFYSTDLCLYFPVTSPFLITRVFSNNI
jgi:hypothetical protein